jgi:hypothetical protein
MWKQMHVMLKDIKIHNLYFPFSYKVRLGA